MLHCVISFILPKKRRFVNIFLISFRESLARFLWQFWKLMVNFVLRADCAKVRCFIIFTIYTVLSIILAYVSRNEGRIFSKIIMQIENFILHNILNFQILFNTIVLDTNLFKYKPWWRIFVNFKIFVNFPISYDCKKILFYHYRFSF